MLSDDERYRQKLLNGYLGRLTSTAKTSPVRDQPNLRAPILAQDLNNTVNVVP